MRQKIKLSLLLALISVLFIGYNHAQTKNEKSPTNKVVFADPLPSWNEGKSKNPF